MAIRVICKNCGSKIEAKDELSGQVRNCPKCKSQILIVPNNENEAPSHESDDIATNVVKNSYDNFDEEIISPHEDDENRIVYDNSVPLPNHNPPAKLIPNHRYFIFAHERMIAYWEINKGWQFNIGTGFVNAMYNKELLPNTGTYKFVELIIEQTETGKRLTGLRTFSITKKWAIPAIGREPEEILSEIGGKAVLTKLQRMKLLAFIRSNYMPDFLSNCKEVYDYLICEYTAESDVFVS